MNSKHSLLIINALLFSICLNSCIEPYDFPDTEAENLLTITGEFTTAFREHTLEINTSGAFRGESEIPLSGAVVQIFDDAGRSANYIETSNGKYVLSPADMTAKVGKSYFIKIQTPNGKIYQSTPEVVQSPVNIDRVFYTIEDDDRSNSLGVTLIRSFIKINIELTPPELQKGPYLKWNTENVYQFIDLSCVPFPFDPEADCYITAFPNRQNIQLYNGDENISELLFRKEVLRKEIDFTFNDKQYFSVYQKSISKRTYDYWLQVNQLINQNGGIFDVPPAPVRGNIFNTENKDELVLGYFEISSADTARVYTLRQDIPFRQRSAPFCGYWYSRPDPLPEGCCNCLDFANSTLEVPFYWE